VYVGKFVDFYVFL